MTFHNSFSLVDVPPFSGEARTQVRITLQVRNLHALSLSPSSFRKKKKKPSAQLNTQNLDLYSLQIIPYDPLIHTYLSRNKPKELHQLSLTPEENHMRWKRNSKKTHINEKKRSSKTSQHKKTARSLDVSQARAVWRSPTAATDRRVL